MIAICCRCHRDGWGRRMMRRGAQVCPYCPRCIDVLGDVLVDVQEEGRARVTVAKQDWRKSGSAQWREWEDG